MKVGLIFPGYGNQFVGMGKEFYDNSRIMQEDFEQAAQCLGGNYVKLCFASSDATLAQLENAYVSLFLVSFSLAAILKQKGVEPSVVAGHNIGEYAAVAAAGGITLPDAVYLLKKYAHLYTEFLKNKRVEAIRVYNIDFEELKKICDNCANGNNISYIASYESDNRALVAGTIDSIACIKKALEDKLMGPVQDVPVGGGLYCPLMDDISKTMKQYLEKVDFKDTKIPFIAGVTGQALKGGDAVRAAVMQQIHAPLQWKKLIDGFEFCDIIAIVGPGKLLLKELAEKYPDKKVMEIVTPKGMNELLALLKKPLFEVIDDDGAPEDDNKNDETVLNDNGEKEK